MKILLGCVLLVWQLGAAEPATQTNHFGIYLVLGPTDPRLTAYGKGVWTNLPLLSAPIISEHDLYSYEWKTHTLRLKGGVGPRSLGNVPVRGIPFVVVANGEKIYLGTFVTGLSSMSFAVPSILAERFGQDPNTMVIGRGYPGEWAGMGPDLRSDERVRKVLEATGKLDAPVPKTTAMEMETSRFLHLTVSTNDTVRVDKPGVGIALIRFLEFGERRARYAWRFQPQHVGDYGAGEGTVDEDSVGHAVMQAGKIELEWSDGGRAKGYVYYYPYRENVKILSREAFDKEL